ncbi:diguanylate cyclase domain-containing protein [Lysobacter firmicutimachus]|uniref:Diguanylate cyclase n=1 Tax=Lysobacter firmicutimachus TaxID=1792846 RepID=A0ABU8CZ68_9GAMM
MSSIEPKRIGWDALLMALLTGVSAWAAMALSRGPGELSAVWIGNGILVGWLLSRPTERWPWYLGAAAATELAVRLGVGDQAVSAAVVAAANLIEALILAGVVRRFVPDVGDPKRWISLGGIATASTLLACAVSGFMAAGAMRVLHAAPFWPGFLTWFSAHVVGLVIFATTTLVAQREGRRMFTAPGRGLSFLLTMALLAAIALAVFLSSYPLLFLAYPPLLLGAIRHRFAGVAVGVVLLTLIGSVATALGHGPLWLADVDTPGRIALLQLYIAGGCLITIPVALAMAERKRLVTGLRDSERRYRMLADYSHDVVVRMRADGQRVYVSPSARDILGWEPAQMLGSRESLVHPEDLERQQRLLAEVIASGEPRTAVYRIRHKNGHYVWIEAVTRAIPAEDGNGMEAIYAGRDITRRVETERALEASRQELERLARFDALTGLANRRQFEERMNLAVLGLNRGASLSLLYLDIDRFKQINDNLGHATGDEVLRSFAQRLLGCVRSGDLAARLGGDEFVVLIEDAAVPSAAEAVARKLIERMRRPIAIGERELSVTTSIGVAYADRPVETAKLLAAADAALYCAKRERNTYCLQAVAADAAPRAAARG